MDFPISVPDVDLLAGEFTDGNVTTGIPASLVPAAWLNNVTNSIKTVQAAAGIAAVENDTTQLLAALKALFVQLGEGATIEGDLVLQETGAEVYLALDAPAGFQRSIYLRTGGVNRWAVGGNNAETSTTSDFVVARIAVDGATIEDHPLSINPDTGIVTFSQTPVYPTAAPGDVTNKGATMSALSAAATAAQAAAITTAEAYANTVATAAQTAAITTAEVYANTVATAAQAAAITTAEAYANTVATAAQTAAITTAEAYANTVATAAQTAAITTAEAYANTVATAAQTAAITTAEAYANTVATAAQAAAEAYTGTVLGNFGTASTKSANYTVLLSDFGSIIFQAPGVASASTFTVPNGSTPGNTLVFPNRSPSFALNLTMAAGATGTFTGFGFGGPSISIPANTTVALVWSAAGYWQIWSFSTGGMLTTTSLTASSGVTVFPDLTLEVWGTGSTSNGVGTVTFPMTFPYGVYLSSIMAVQITNSGAPSASGSPVFAYGPSVTTTGMTVYGITGTSVYFNYRVRGR